MEFWTEVRRAVLRDGESKRSVCKRFNIHFKTLEKILANPEPPGYSAKKPRRKPVIGPHLSFIEEIIEGDKSPSVPAKQRHTAKRIFERLKSERGYSGGYTAVKEAVVAIRRHTGEVFFPLAHDPGWAQFDFGHAEAYIAGERTKAAFAVMSLPNSDACHITCYPRETTEAFLDAHLRAFQFFGGVPGRISYDNSKIAVAQITGSHSRVTTAEFNRLKSHFLFEDHFCAIRRSNEKGHVENTVGFVRRNFLVPIPHAGSFLELNKAVEGRCREVLSRTTWGDTRTVGERLEEERAHLLPIPPGFIAARVFPARANSLSLVRVDNNDYSVPTQVAHHDVSVQATPWEVKISKADRVVARHKRLWTKGGVSFEPRHYLALLEKKPGALDFAKPLKALELTEEFEVLRARLEAEGGDWGMHEYIKVLRLLEHSSVPAVAKAVAKGLSIGSHSSDAIALILAHANEKPAGLFSLDERPHLKPYSIPAPDLSLYSALTSPVVAR
jgi:transposase